MEPTKDNTPLAVLHLAELDVELIEALTKHWLVTVEQQDELILYKLYEKV